MVPSQMGKGHYGNILTLRHGWAVLHPWGNSLDARGGDTMVEGHTVCPAGGQGLVSKGCFSLE